MIIIIKMDYYNFLLCQIYLGSLFTFGLYVSVNHVINNLETLLLEIKESIDERTLIRQDDIDLGQEYINRSFLLKELNSDATTKFHEPRRLHTEKQNELNKEIQESNIYKNSHELRQRKVNAEIENINNNTKSWFNILN
jgi:hypothetical protein